MFLMGTDNIPYGYWWYSSCKLHILTSTTGMPYRYWWSSSRVLRIVTTNWNFHPKGDIRLGHWPLPPGKKLTISVDFRLKSSHTILSYLDCMLRESVIGYWSQYIQGVQYAHLLLVHLHRYKSPLIILFGTFHDFVETITSFKLLFCSLSKTFSSVKPVPWMWRKGRHYLSFECRLCTRLFAEK